MKKIKIKFYLSLIFLINSIIIAVFFSNNIEILEKILIPIFFIYFVIDSLTVLFPVFNTSIYSGKHLNKFYNETNVYNKDLLTKQIKQQNIRSLFIFLVYFLILTIIGVLYINIDAFKPIHLYIVFFFLNFGDYLSILVWCPFKSLVLKNACCNRCRITNWDRLMKFYILIFIPSIYSIILLILGIIIFVVFEYNHYKYPERFYSISNKSLSCKMCPSEIGCIKNKE